MKNRRAIRFDIDIKLATALAARGDHVGAWRVLENMDDPMAEKEFAAIEELVRQLPAPPAL